MVHYLLKIIAKKIIIISILLATVLAYGQDIKYTFANAQNTNNGSKDYYEVDVLVESSVDFKLGSGQLYFNYNTEAFGENISVNSKFEYTQPSDYILGEVYSFPAYKDFIQNDNTVSRVSISFQQGVSSGTITANNVTSTPKKLFHLKIEYVDVSKLPELAFEIGASFLDQTFTACGPAASGFPDCTSHPGEQLTNDSFDSTGGQVLSVNSEMLSNSFNLYPNPANEYITVKINDDFILKELTVFNVLGKKVKTAQNKWDKIIISNLNSGTYYIKVKTDKGEASKKLIVNN